MDANHADLMDYTVQPVQIHIIIAHLMEQPALFVLWSVPTAYHLALVLVVDA
jgi:hypothetical protein